MITLAAGGLAAAAFAIPDLGARSKAVVRLKACSRQHHAAVFYARMRRVRGTRRMRMRFTLLQRRDEIGRFRRVYVPALRHWRKSEPGVHAFGYKQEVRGLKDGHAYRMLVRYRWFGADGEVLRHTRRSSRICRMFLPLPNLQVKLVGAGPTTNVRVWHYDMRVTNAGEAPASNVAVQLSVDGKVAKRFTIPSLASGQARLVTRLGPACRSSYQAVIDPYDAIAESDETDNAHQAYCSLN